MNKKEMRETKYMAAIASGDTRLQQLNMWSALENLTYKVDIFRDKWLQHVAVNKHFIAYPVTFSILPIVSTLYGMATISDV